MSVKIRKYQGFFHFSLARTKPPVPSSFTVRGGPKDQIRDAQKTTYRRQHSSKDHDHGSHEEEEEGEEGSEEDLIRTFFRIRERLDESPAALLLSLAVRVIRGAPDRCRRTRRRSPARYRPSKPLRAPPSRDARSGPGTPR